MAGWLGTGSKWQREAGAELRKHDGTVMRALVPDGHDAVLPVRPSCRWRSHVSSKQSRNISKLHGRGHVTVCHPCASSVCPLQASSLVQPMAAAQPQFRAKYWFDFES